MNFIEEYSLSRGKYEKYSRKLYNLFSEILQEHDIKYSAIEYRTKTIESFAEKISRSGKSYSNPLTDITDLTGIRIILYYLDDLIKVRDIIKSEFSIDERNSRDNKESLNFDQFGYLSIHEIIQVKTPRASLPEWKILVGLFAEVQIRTVLQHAWASISHTLQYKNENDIPKELRRQLHRLSGLFELADEQFLEIKAKRDVVINDINLSIETDRYALVQINMDSLRVYIDYSKTVNTLTSLIHRTSFILGLSENAIDEEEDKSNQALSQLVSLCNIFGMNTLNELDNMLKESMSLVVGHIETFTSERLREGSSSISGKIEHVIAVLIVIFFGRDENKTSIRKIVTWGDDYLETAISVIP